VGPRAGLDSMTRKILTLPGLQLRPHGHPARSQSLYGLRYPIQVLYAFLTIRYLHWKGQVGGGGDKAPKKVV
jgi:hypothetical protein